VINLYKISVGKHENLIRRDHLENLTVEGNKILK
jgi:hypothetical protein